jgi:hypothetical protein
LLHEIKKEGESKMKKMISVSVATIFLIYSLNLLAIVAPTPQIKSGVDWIEVSGTIQSDKVAYYAIDGVMFKPVKIGSMEVQPRPVFQNFGEWQILEDNFFSVNYTNLTGEKISYKFKIIHSPVKQGEIGLLWFIYGLVGDEANVVLRDDGTAKIVSFKDLSGEQKDRIREYAGNVTAVKSRDKLATTWGSIKK